MGLRGPAPKSTEIRTFEGVPERPRGMPAAARKIWAGYVGQLAGSLRLVDAFALRRLCEDVALLEELQAGLRRMASDLRREAKTRGEHLSGGAMIALAKTHEGRRLTTTINSLAGRIQRQELQFGLTPASAGRLGDGLGGAPLIPTGDVDGLERALCG